MIHQQSFDDLGTRLDQLVFVVVDLETTGGSPAQSEITEIGAMRVQAGRVLGSFSSLTRPHSGIPAFISALTGITNAMVADAPALHQVLPTFDEFAQLGTPGTVLVAHNAPFDVGFLKAAYASQERPWPAPLVLDTARLARTVLHRDEVPNCKLSTLAAHFRATTTPTHRALDDVLATVDVLHGLLERAGNLGAQTWEDLRSITSRVTTAQRTKRHLAAGMPAGPGVYVFRDRTGRALYVGTSRNLRSRVRSYFTASEQRRRISEMIAIAERVEPIACATALEAHVRELRLIASEQPAYNRRSKRPDAQAWVKLTVEPWPRLSVVSVVRDDQADGARYLGPFASRGSAASAVEALLAAIALRTCTSRLPKAPKPGTRPCVQAQLGRCAAPCSEQGDAAAYLSTVEDMREAMSGDLRKVSQILLAKVDDLARDGRFEEAATWRDRLQHVLVGAERAARSAMLATTEELVAACPTPERGWEVHLVRYGRLAGAAVVGPGRDPLPVIEALIVTGEQVVPPVAPASAGLAEETSAILRWLDTDGVRLARSTRALALPMHVGAPLLGRLQAAKAAASGFTHEGNPRDRPMGPAQGTGVSRLLTA